LTTSEGSSERALILAPNGRDADIAAAIVREAGLTAIIVLGIAELCVEVEKGAGLALIAEEALLTSDLRPLSSLLGKQESWSDFPFVVMILHGGGPERNPAAARIAEILGNVSFVERPFHPTTLVSVVCTAIRGRRRQYAARASLASLQRSQSELAALTATLEQRVEERTRQLQESEAALRQAQKMDAIGQLTGGVAHDFNNLLMAIMGNLDLLKKYVGDNDRCRRLVDGALQGALRGASLTQRMLAFARQQDLRTEWVDLAHLIQGMEDLLDRTLGPRTDLALEVQPNLPLANVDSNQIELAILNLVINSRDAMPDGGRITVSADYPKTIPSALMPGRYIRVQVIDTGIGMDEETLKKAIDPFFSTKEIGRGTGLGLSMVHGLAVQLGGLFELQSTVNVGTSATLWLPAPSQPAGAVHAPLEPVAVTRTPQTSARILLVEDDALIAMATVDMLEDLGHQVREAHSGAAALEILAEQSKPDLIISDYAMPGMTGLELFEVIRRDFPHLPFLLATGYAELPPGQGSDLPRLAKPYRQETLKAAVDKLLEG
jgi:signal transduction histidine kinase/CheY-like chemotaxis protein